MRYEILHSSNTHCFSKYIALETKVAKWNNVSKHFLPELIHLLKVPHQTDVKIPNLTQKGM